MPDIAEAKAITSRELEDSRVKDTIQSIWDQLGYHLQHTGNSLQRSIADAIYAAYRQGLQDGFAQATYAAAQLSAPNAQPAP